MRFILILHIALVFQRVKLEARTPWWEMWTSWQWTHQVSLEIHEKDIWFLMLASRVVSSKLEKGAIVIPVYVFILYVLLFFSCWWHTTLVLRNSVTEEAAKMRNLPETKIVNRKTHCKVVEFTDSILDKALPCCWHFI